MPEHIAPTKSHGLVEVLDRVLDKGLVIAGDIKINLANVELLTIQIRLLVCSIDKAQQIGLNWWQSDPRLSSSQSLAVGTGSDADARLRRIEEQLQRLLGESESQSRGKRGGK